MTQPALGVGVVVALRQRVACVTTGVQRRKVPKVATSALYFPVVALVHFPQLDVLIPRGYYVIPGGCRVVALDAVLASPPGMSGLVTVRADVMQALKVWETVTLETVSLGVGALELHRMARRIDF